MAIRLLSRPGGVAAGVHRVPGDKSISHRALMLSAAAGGETIIENFLNGSDCRATADALRDLGAGVEFIDTDRVRIASSGKFTSPEKPLDLGNSGTGMRLLAGLLAGRDVIATLTGDASLRRRPMRRVTQPLSRMGASIETSPDGTAPMVVHGKAALRGIDYPMPVASAQVKSALLLAGLAAKEPVIIHEPAVMRDHTERLLRAFGVVVHAGDHVVRLEPDARLLSPGRIAVPGDLSSAAFLFAAAAMTPDASVTVENVGVNPTRTGVLKLLERMGADVRIDNPRDVSGEPVADVTVTGKTLAGIEITPADVALTIDEIPVLLAVAAVAEGETTVRGAGELKVKESDRLATMAEGLAVLGIGVALLDDSIRVSGGSPRGGRIDSHGDHRVAMSFAVLGQRVSGPVEILDADNIETSFPGFVALMQRMGLDITELSP